MRRGIPTLIAFALLAATAANADNHLKDLVVGSIDAQFDDMTRMSDAIWSHAEIALEETESSALLADYAEAQGFNVTRGVAGMPTAFIAEYGEGEPVIGVLGEFDALPRLSQSATPSRDPVVEGGPGHGCGHNLFGVASLAAATAIKERIEASNPAHPNRHTYRQKNRSCTSC